MLFLRENRDLAVKLRRQPDIELAGIGLFRLYAIFFTPRDIIVNGVLKNTLYLIDRCALKCNNVSGIDNVPVKNLRLRPGNLYTPSYKRIVL